MFNNVYLHYISYVIRMFLKSKFSKASKSLSVCVFSFSFEGMFHTSLGLTCWVYSLVWEHRPVGAGGGSLTYSSLICFLNIFLPTHTSLNFHSLSLIPDKAWGWVGGGECLLLWVWKNVYSELLPWDEDQEKQMGEMLKCLQLISWQGAGSEELSLLMTWFTSGPCKK